jgi:hypothetical protein
MKLAEVFVAGVFLRSFPPAGRFLSGGWKTCSPVEFSEIKQEYFGLGNREALHGQKG